MGGRSSSTMAWGACGKSFLPPHPSRDHSGTTVRRACACDVVLDVVGHSVGIATENVFAVLATFVGLRHELCACTAGT